MNIHYDVAIVGSGPAGLYAAYGLISKNPKYNIVVIEKGKTKDGRKCPSLLSHSKCLNCKICHIMSGLGGAGFQSDSKFPITNDFGGNLWEKIGRGKSLELQKKVDSINRQFYYENIGCKNEHNISWLEYNKPEQSFPKLYSSKSSTYKKICTQHNLHLLDADIRHLGTDIGQVIYGKLYDFLVENGVQFEFETDVNTIKQVEETINIDSISDRKYHWEVNCSNDKVFEANTVVVAAGRSGSEWVEQLCQSLNIPTKSNKVDIGIRFECPDEIWNHITKDLYESKIVYKTKLYEDEVRTFCMNPSGEVVTENTNGLITVNGHAFEDKNKKTNNTNFALLVSRTFTEPFKDSTKYGNAIVALSNMTVDVNENLEANGYRNLYIIGDGSGWTHSLSQSSASGLYIAEKILNK